MNERTTSGFQKDDRRMKILENVERRIDALVRGWTERLLGRPTDPNVIEIKRAVLEDVARAVEPVGRGENLFPFDRLVLRVASPDPSRRALLETAFRDRRFLEEVRNRIRQARAEPPVRMTLEVEGAEAPGEDWADPRYVLELSIVATPPARREGGRAGPLLRVTRGRAPQRRYPIGTGRVNIGRSEDVLDEAERIVRRNDVAFEDDGDEINLTVSRAHAHLSYDEATLSWRIADDNSAYGTRVFRRGSSIEVPRGPRGIRLQSGDEIYCGQACLSFESGE